MQFATIRCILQTCTFNLCLLSSSCQVLISFTEDLKAQIKDWSKLIRNDLNQLEVKVKFVDFIQFHSAVKELRNTFPILHDFFSNIDFDFVRFITEILKQNDYMILD